MTQHHKDMSEHRQRQVRREGYSPDYRAFHEVYITSDLGPQKSQDLMAYIGQHIAEFNGKTESKHGIPLMLFEKKQDAQRFADEISSRFQILHEHISIKAEKFTC